MPVYNSRIETVVSFSGVGDNAISLLRQLAAVLEAEELDPSTVLVSINYEGRDEIDYLLTATAIDPTPQWPLDAPIPVVVTGKEDA